jgi:hyperosmotically inducible protein
MSIKKLASAAAIAALFAVPLAGQAQTQSPSTLVKDSAITAKIKAAQAADSTVRATQIDVETDNNGVVTLSGTARSQAEIDRAVQIARGVDGVTSVNNRMTLASTSGTAGTTGSTGTMGATGSTGTTTGTTGTTTDSTMSGGMRAPRSDRG